MFVVIVGGGRVGSTLAERLLADGHKVRLIEPRPQVVEHLHRELPTEVIVQGNPTDVELLEYVRLREAQVLAAVLSDDADNLAVTSLARFMFGVPRIIARVNDPRKGWLFTPEMGVDVALSQAEIFTSLIEEEMSLGDMMVLLKLRRGRYTLVEEKIPPGAPAIGKSIMELQLPDECVIAAIIRHGKVIMPRGKTRFEVEDEVLAVTNREGAEALRALFSPAGTAPSPERSG